MTAVKGMGIRFMLSVWFLPSGGQRRHEYLRQMKDHQLPIELIGSRSTGGEGDVPRQNTVTGLITFELLGQVRNEITEP